MEVFVIFILGLLIYFFYGIRHSQERWRNDSERYRLVQDGDVSNQTDTEVEEYEWRHCTWRPFCFYHLLILLQIVLACSDNGLTWDYTLDFSLNLLRTVAAHFVKSSSSTSDLLDFTRSANKGCCGIFTCNDMRFSHLVEQNQYTVYLTR